MKPKNAHLFPVPKNLPWLAACIWNLIHCLYCQGPNFPMLLKRITRSLHKEASEGKVRGMVVVFFFLFFLVCGREGGGGNKAPKLTELNLLTM